MQTALVLSADKWSLTDEKTGEVRAGASVWFTNDYRESTESAVGYKPTKVTADNVVFDELAKIQLPAIVQMEFGSRPGAQGKATLTLISVKPVRTFNPFAGEKSEKKAA